MCRNEHDGTLVLSTLKNRPPLPVRGGTSIYRLPPLDGGWHRRIEMNTKSNIEFKNNADLIDFERSEQAHPLVVLVVIVTVAVAAAVGTAIALLPWFEYAFGI